MFFEGSEKKLEISIKSSAKSLRAYGRSQWEKVVEKSRASILSEISNEQQDAYLLSESSLFVTDNRLTMITCGTTTLANAALAICKFVPKDDIEFIVYERKREIFPEYQRSNFYQDVKDLSAEFDGEALRFGDADDHHIYLFHSKKQNKLNKDDNTLEVLMHGLERNAASVFEGGSKHTRENIDKSGVREILSDYQVDDFIFEPQGYSLNAIKKDKYFTIHVTPQAIGSYVSFETNEIANDDIESLVNKLIKIFKPSSCDVLLFRSEASGEQIKCNYSLKRRVIHNVCGYQVNYNHYYKPQLEQTPAEKLNI